MCIVCSYVQAVLHVHCAFLHTGCMTCVLCVPMYRLYCMCIVCSYVQAVLHVHCAFLHTGCITCVLCVPTYRLYYMCMLYVCLFIQAEEGEAVPEELANVIMRKSSEPSAEISSKSREPEDAGALTREKELRERVSREKEELSTVVDGLQNKVSELTRRHADARRAYEQEKRVSTAVCVHVCTCVCACVCVRVHMPFYMYLP